MSDTETVLQFGAGRFLRAFVDRFLQHVADAGRSAGKAVVVQSTAGSRADLLAQHPEGYQVLVRGMSGGELVDRVERVGTVSRALLADRDWAEVLQVAISPDLKTIVTNATEAGYALSGGEQLSATAAETMPGRLTQTLFARFVAMGAPLVILPCELIERNADKLKELVRTQAAQWSLGDEFAAWLLECQWLNNLVDCIVTVPPPDHPLTAQDPLLVCVEPYALWAIEWKAPVAPFLTHPAIRYVTDLQPFYLRKVRILNGTHTAMASKFLPAGFKTVHEVLSNAEAIRWVRGLIFEEIVPTIASKVDDVAEFADATFDRLRNPFLNHRLSDIVMNHAAKVQVRLQPTYDEYVRLFGKPPRRISEVLDWRPTS